MGAVVSTITGLPSRSAWVTRRASAASRRGQFFAAAQSSSTTSRSGPLPRNWAHFKGLYHYGNRAIVSYTVDETPVLEMPGAICYFNPGGEVLRDDGSPETIAWITIAVVILAPVSEELIFRVILQGALRSKLSASVSIAISSVTFVLVHGFPDMLALLPLAVVFGYVYERTHSYLAVVRESRLRIRRASFRRVISLLKSGRSGSHPTNTDR